MDTIDFGHADGPIDVDGRLPAVRTWNCRRSNHWTRPTRTRAACSFAARAGSDSWEQEREVVAACHLQSSASGLISRTNLPIYPRRVRPRGRRRPRYERDDQIPAQQPEHGASSTGYVHEAARNEVRPRRYANAAWTTLLCGLTESGVGRSVGAPVVSAFPTGTSPASAKRVVETGNSCLKKRAVVATSE